MNLIFDLDLANEFQQFLYATGPLSYYHLCLCIIHQMLSVNFTLVTVCKVHGQILTKFGRNQNRGGGGAKNLESLANLQIS